VFAAAILTGLRKGELCGLRKDDLDLPRQLLYVRRCYERPFPNSKKQRVVGVPKELVPFLEHAVAIFGGPWLFPDPDGSMRTRPWQPEDVLRRALQRAGVASIRRLQLQRGVARSDFPGLSEKQIARIERGETPRPRPATLLARAPVDGPGHGLAQAA
jgi:integrase